MNDGNKSSNVQKSLKFFNKRPITRYFANAPLPIVRTIFVNILCCIELCRGLWITLYISNYLQHDGDGSFWLLRLKPQKLLKRPTSMELPPILELYIDGDGEHNLYIAFLNAMQ
uniref:Uncharacterized protein n=1 Tax=Glossina brevipalpis TaxID=37001 RepID=A0A1A9WZM3_9MUSC